tara:strand:+ start:60060 stop:60608 length:549 start_codon:yes stop_codon:yes gene_type:complete
MKRAILSAVVILVASQATLAKSGAECKLDLAQISSQYKNGKYLLEQKDGVPDIADCKNVDLPAENVDNKVFITADKSALIIQNNKTQTLSFSIIPGKITDYAVMAGRLIISTADNKVLVVGRNGNIFEMLTSTGKSYSDVKSIKIDKGVLVMEQNANAPIPLTEEQVTKRINDAGKFRALSF